MIEIRGLKKCFNDFIALNNVNININSGEIYGLIGPNGAGKTTLINTIIGLLKIDDGSIKINNNLVTPPYDEKIKEKFGFIPDDPILLDHLTGYENLEFFSYLYKKNFDKNTIKTFLQEFDIDYAGDKLVKSYSKGMKQKLMLSSLLINNPNIIFLDEPTTGLDPLSISELKNKILNLKSPQKTFIISTHDMAFVEELCDKVCIIYKGEILLEDTVSNIYIKTETNSLEESLVKLISNVDRSKQ